MTYATRKWLHGLGAVFIGTASNAAAGSITSALVEKHVDWPVVAMTAMVSGGVAAALYLKQFPLPEWTGEDRRGEPKAASPDAAPTAQVAKTETPL
jgi:hypothetical protein